MFGITLPKGSHKDSEKYAYEDLTPERYKSEVYLTLVRALSKKHERTQKDVKNEIAGIKSKIEKVIDDCYPDMSVTNCVKKVMDNYSSFLNKELKENYIMTLERFEYFLEMEKYSEEIDGLNESESNLDDTLRKYAEEYSDKIVRGKKIPASKLKSILKKVHSRGMQAFRHAPQSVRPWIRKMGDPAGAIVWGTSRVKAFLRKSKGTWHKFDSDLADDVIKYSK